MSTTTDTTRDWEGRTIFDRTGEKLGTIESIYLVEETGKPEWALVRLGLLRGATLVPLEGASETAEGIRASCDKATVSDAPAIRGDDEPAPDEVEAIYRHYDTAANGAAATRAPQQTAARRQQPADPHAAALVPTLKRVVKEFNDDKLPHWAAALTYYAVLSIFPAMLALVSVLGLIGSSAIQPLVDNLSTLAPGPARDIVMNALRGLQDGGASGVLLVVSLAVAIWSASGYVSAFMDAANSIYDTDEGRSLLKRVPLRIGVTIMLLAVLAIGALAVVLTGPIAEQAGDLIGIGGSVVAVWDVAKWPLLVLLVAFLFAALYYTTPNVKQPGLKAVAPGGLLAVVLWLLVSLAFAFYVANFGSYNKTYGALGGVIVFLVWLWLTNIAILLGAEFNAERARGRRIESGMQPPDREPYLPQRARP